MRGVVWVDRSGSRIWDRRRGVAVTVVAALAREAVELCMAVGVCEPAELARLRVIASSMAVIRRSGETADSVDAR